VVDNFVDILQVDPAGLRAIVVSHGHVDHHGGLQGLAARTGRRLPLLIHPEAWRERKVTFPAGTELRLPPPSRADLEAEDLEVVEERGPTLLVDNQVLISGEVPRVTGFETGFPTHAGAVNVLHNARRLTGRDQIAGFVGGFHLTGAVFEPIIDPTIAALTDLGVERFVPGHCTGWKATHRLAAALPDAFIQPSVGTVLRF
jgi:7,8-dihydropterin-6-yl-methyl-4-(beta-D-ribofuranosyl)aminobenzene 5'-phosphate synthase